MRVRFAGPARATALLAASLTLLAAGAAAETERRPSRRTLAGSSLQVVGSTSAPPAAAAKAPTARLVTTTSGTRAVAARRPSPRMTSITSGPASAAAATAAATSIQRIGERDRMGALGTEFLLEVKVVDENGDGVGGAGVTWQASRSAVLGPGTPSSGDAGLAALTVEPLEAGETVVTAKLQGAGEGCQPGECVDFSLVVEAGELRIVPLPPTQRTALLGTVFQLEVQVLDENDMGVGGVAVTWQADQGAELAPGSPTSSTAAGFAAVTVEPRLTGPTVVTARIEDAGPDCPDSDCALFTLTAVVGIRGETPDQAGCVGSFDDLMARVVGLNGAGKPDIPVAWNLIEGAVEAPPLPTEIVSGAQGLTTLSGVTLGAEGTARLTARLGPDDCKSGPELPGVVCVAEFALTASLDLTIAAIGGDGQSGAVGAALSDPLAVEVKGCDGPASGIVVAWELTRGAALLESASTPTNPQGRAGIRVTPQQAGAIEIAAKLPGAGGECPAGLCALFGLTGTDPAGPGPPSEIPSSLDGGGFFDLPVDQEQAFEVQLVQQGVPERRAGAEVVWDLSRREKVDASWPQTVPTDATGRSVLSITPNSTGEGIELTATLGSGEGCVTSCQAVITLTFTRKEQPQNQIAIVRGNGQSGPVDQPFPERLAVQVTRDSGLQAGVQVSWELTGGDALLEASSTVTDSAGQASIQVTPRGAGAISVAAKLPRAGPGCPAGACVIFGLTAESAPAPPTPPPGFTTVASDLALRIAQVNLGQILTRLMTLRRAGPEMATEFAALEIQGVRVPIDALARIGEPPAETAEAGFELARLLSGEERGGAAGEADAAPGSGARDRLGLFVSGILAFGDRPQAAQEVSFDFHTDGLMVGMDYDFGNFFAGAAVSFVSTGSDLAGGAGKVDTEGASLASYLLFFPETNSDKTALYLDAVVSVGRNDFSQERLDEQSGGRARADFSGDQLALHLGGGYDRNFGPVVVGGFASLSYVSAEIADYRETSLDGADRIWLVDVDRQEVASLLASLGLDVSYYKWFRGRILAPGLRVAYRSEMDDDSQLITGRFRASGFNPPVGFVDGFQAPTAPPDRGYFNVAVSLLASFEWGSMALGYDEDLGRSDFDLRAVTMGVRLAF